MKQIYKYNPKIQARSLCAFFALLMVMTFGASCNKDFPNTLKTNYKNDTLGIHVKSQKVLYIIVDGMRGGALKTLNTPNISKILSHSVYTYDGLSDFDGVNTTNAGGWTNMLTGVSRSKHNVVTEDFAGNDIAGFPTLFTRLKQLGENELRTASFSASTTFSANLATDAVENKVFQNDDLSVKNAANEELKNPQAAVVLAHFQDVEKAGKENSYSAEDPVYAAAITQMDSYIGELLGNLVKRPTYNTENWLVVIASNKGGVLPPDPLSTDKTMFSDLNRNTFIVFYNPRFNSQILPKPNTDNVPFTGNGIRVRASASYAVVPDDGGLYNFGSSGDYTVQLKFKTKSPITTSWPAFFSKKAGALESIVGWYMYCEGNSWTVILKGANGASSLNSGSKTISDGLWHTVTFVISNEAGRRYASTYTDGVLNASKDITGIGSLNTAAPLRIGQLPDAYGSNNLDFVMADIEIYNKAISAADVLKYSGNTVIDSSNPNFSSLIGYWPVSEGEGPKIADFSGSGKHFVNSGEYTWESFSDVSPFLTPPLNPLFYRLVPNNVDIPFYIYQWLGVSIPSSWAQEGKLWKTSFTDVKLPY